MQGPGAAVFVHTRVLPGGPTRGAGTRWLSRCRCTHFLCTDEPALFFPEGC